MIWRQGVLVGILALTLAACTEDETVSDADVVRLARHARELFAHGAYREALDSAQAGLELSVLIGREANIAEGEKLLADLETAGADFDGAIDHYTRAIQRYRRLNDRANVRGMIITLGHLYTIMDDDESAYGVVEEAYRIAEAGGNTDETRDYAVALLPIARRLGLDEDLLRASDALSRSGGLVPSSALYALLQHERGLFAVRQGRVGASVDLFRDAMVAAGNAGDSLLTITALRDLARSLDAMGDFNRAMATYTDALQRSDSLKNGRAIREELLFRVGNAMLREGKPGDARRFYHAAFASARDRGNTLGKAYALLQLSHCARLLRESASVGLAQDAVTLLRDVYPPAAMAYARGTLGMAQLAGDFPIDAFDEMSQAVESADYTERIRDPDNIYVDCEQAVLGNLATPWRDLMVDLQIRLKRNDEALIAALKRSGSVLHRQLKGINLHCGTDSLNLIFSQWRAATAREAGAEEILDQALSSPEASTERISVIREVMGKHIKEAQSFAGALIAKRPDIASFVMERFPMEAALWQRFPPGSAFVMYGTSATSLQVFVLSSSVLSLPVIKIDRTQLSQMCSTYVFELRHLSDAANSESASRLQQAERHLIPLQNSLYDLFVKPLQRDLNGVGNIFIVPPDDLPFFPIHAVRRDGLPGTSLIERCNVSYCAPALLSEREVLLPPVKEAMAFAQGGKSGRDAEYELRDLRLFSKDAQILQDKQATLPALFGGRGDHLHMAIDLHWDMLRPGNSFVELPDPTSGVMRHVPVGELTRIGGFPNVTAFLYGSGIAFGPSRLPAVLFAGGAKEVIINGIWTGRKSNKTFAEAFYTALQSGKPVSIAYRIAIMDLSKRKDSLLPFWAPYVLWRR